LIDFSIVFPHVTNSSFHIDLYWGIKPSLTPAVRVRRYLKGCRTLPHREQPHLIFVDRRISIELFLEVFGSEEIERFDRALRLVERYEDYLFRRALGVALIVCGVSFPLTAFMILKAQAFADLLNMSPAAFIAFAPTITLLASVVIIVYVFTSAHLVYSRMREGSFWTDFPHMAAMFLIWFLSFYLTRYVPEPYFRVSWLWAGGSASLISYLFMKRQEEHWDYPVLLVIGLICTVSSLPLLLIGDAQLSTALSFTVFGVSFIAGGVYSLFNASRVLSESEK